jgi:elongation factor P--(R)-beta-lysine ligase
MEDTASGDWKPTASLEALRFRAGRMRAIREFFHQRDVLEVETPLLSPCGAVDQWIDSFQVKSTLQRDPLWLSPSPEFHMKRLLASGSGPIWQMGKAFRDEGAGRRHNPEFTLLEWYRPGWSLRELCGEVEDLARAVAPDFPAARWLSFREAFLERAGVDPFRDPVDKIRHAAEESSSVLPALAEDDRDGWIDLLMVTRVEPGLGDPAPVFLWGYPPSRAALAKLGNDDGIEVALRAELYWKGVELSNGYDELVDPAEQLARFQAESRARHALGKPTPPIDHSLVEALRAGLPAGSGVALGVDRLIALAFGAESIREVLAFGPAI